MGQCATNVFFFLPELERKSTGSTGTHPELLFQIVNEDRLVVAVGRSKRVEENHQIGLDQSTDVSYVDQNSLRANKDHRHLVVEAAIDLAQISGMEAVLYRIRHFRSMRTKKREHFSISIRMVTHAHATETTNHFRIYLLAQIALQELAGSGLDVALVVKFRAAKLDLVLNGVVGDSSKRSLQSQRRIGRWSCMEIRFGGYGGQVARF